MGGVQRHQKRSSWKISLPGSTDRVKELGEALSRCLDKEVSCQKKGNFQVSGPVLFWDTHMKPC